MPDNNRKPSLRFKGFTDAWEQREFGYFFDERNERTGIGEMISVTMNSGIKKFKDLDRFDSKPEDLSKYKKVVVGDIAFNSMRMWQGASGYSPYTGILSPAYTVITPKSGNSSLFFSYVLKKPEMIQLFQKSSQGLTKDTWNLKFPAFSKLLTFAPNNYDEQCRIANILAVVDSLITLHQRKYDKLVGVKKALLDKMFPETGNDVPKMRFKGFTDAWEQCELVELISKGGSGGTPTSTNPNYYNGSIPFLSITDISNSNGFIFRTEKYITEMGLNNSAAWIVPKESISLAMYASVGKVAILKENIATSQAFYNLVIDNLITRDYVFHFLKKMEMNREWDSLISTGTQANLNAEKVKKLKIIVPANIDEQARLGTLFNHIDSLITLHQRKHEKLQNIKKALLSKMFA